MTLRGILFAVKSLFPLDDMRATQVRSFCSPRMGNADPLTDTVECDCSVQLRPSDPGNSSGPKQ